MQIIMLNKVAHLAKKIGSTFAIALALAATPLSVQAQGSGQGVFTQLANLVSGNIDPADESIKILSGVLGSDFVTNPTSQIAGGPATVLGVAFSYFNWFVFLVAMAWMSYVAGSSLLQTMHEGKVLGQRFSTVWLPLRIGFGALSLMPVFKGFCFAQVLMMICALTGIAGANLVSKSAIDAASGFTTLVTPSIKTKNSLIAANPVEQYLLEGALCMKAAETTKREQNDYALGSAPTYNFIIKDLTPPNVPNNGNSQLGFQVQFAGPSGPAACGNLRVWVNPRGSTSLFGSRIAGINYPAIARQGIAAHRQAASQTTTEAINIADGAGDKSRGDKYDAAMAAFNNGFFGSYTGKVQTAFQQSSNSPLDAAASSAISNQITNQMKRAGWISLGAYYGVFAEVTEAINQTLDPKTDWQKATEDFSKSIAAELMDTLTAASKQSGDSGMAGPGMFNTPTGNQSIGQWIVGGVINQTTSGGQTAGNLNPIIAFKTMGDNIMVIAEVFIAVGTAASVVDGFVGGDPSKFTDPISKFVGGLASKVTGWVGVLIKLGSALAPIGWVMFVIAAIMAFYIPLVPFIQWFAAIMRWVVSLFESLVGASLWALAHFDSDGEGMGQRASYGYLYALSNFAYPSLLVLAFLIASGLITVLGTFLFAIFGSVMSSAQGNSYTGLVSIVAYITIFMVLGLTLVTGIFNMMLHLAEKVLAFIGSHGNTSIGSEVESKVNTMFISAANGGRGALVGMMAPKRPGGLGGKADADPKTPQTTAGLGGTPK